MDAKFILSAASKTDFPRTGVPEVAMVGRSNVGKSTLINALVKQKIARTSAAPGKTRLANYYLIQSRSAHSESSIYLVDLPGYGYARGGTQSAEEFEVLTRQYFDPPEQSGRRLAGVLHLMDARHPDMPQDAAAFEWLLRHGSPMAIVATKMDKLNRSEQTQSIKTLETRYGALVIPASAPHGLGLADIWKLIGQWTDPDRLSV